MGDWAVLLTAIAAIVGSMLTGTAAVITAMRSGPRERKKAAKRAVELFAEAAADGEITTDELAEIAAAVAEEEQAGGDEP